MVAEVPGTVPPTAGNGAENAKAGTVVNRTATCITHPAWMAVKKTKDDVTTYESFVRGVPNFRFERTVIGDWSHFGTDWKLVLTQNFCEKAG